MSTLGEAVGGLAGGIQGLISTQGDKNAAEQKYASALAAAKGYGTQAAGIGSNAYDKVDPTSRNAMLAALADYENKTKMGGLDAKGQANLEMTQARAAQTGAQTAHQIQANAQARGAAQGPASMVAQQVAQQQNGQGARFGALQSAAMAEDAKNAALSGQMTAAGNVYGMDANKANAANQIAEFNVRNAQQNISNNARQADQQIGVYGSDAAMREARAKRDNAEFAGAGKAIGGSAGGIVGSLMGDAGGGGISAIPGGQGIGGTDFGV